MSANSTRDRFLTDVEETFEKRGVVPLTHGSSTGEAELIVLDVGDTRSTVGNRRGKGLGNLFSERSARYRLGAKVDDLEFEPSRQVCVTTEARDWAFGDLAEAQYDGEWYGLEAGSLGPL